MAVRADDAVAGTDQALFRQNRMLDAHTADVKEILDVVLVGKAAHPLDLLGRLDVLVRGEMVHHQRHPAFVEHPAGTAALKLVDRHRRGDVVAEAQIELRLDQLPRLHLRQAGVRRQDLLCHGHTHSSVSSLSLMSL